MDPAQLQRMLESFQAMAKTNQELAAAEQAGARTNQQATNAMNNAANGDTTTGFAWIVRGFALCTVDPSVP